MEFDCDWLGRDHRDVAQAVPAARPGPRDRFNKAVVCDDLMGDEKVKDGFLAVVDVRLRVVAFHSRDDDDGARYVVRPLLFQHPSRVTFPVAVDRCLGTSARLQVLP